MTTVCIVDIDTTLANNDHRAALLKRELDGKISQESWDAFLSADLMLLDQPQKHAKDVLDYMRNHNYIVVFLTGRNIKHMDVTSIWLQTHMGWNPLTEALIMRGTGATGVPPSVFKENAFKEFIEMKNLTTAKFLFFEDDLHVINIWKKYGLVFKCPEVWEYMNVSAPEEQEQAWSR